jgi:hypothetical protein
VAATATPLTVTETEEQVPTFTFRVNSMLLTNAGTLESSRLTQ